MDFLAKGVLLAIARPVDPDNSAATSQRSVITSRSFLLSFCVRFLPRMSQFLKHGQDWSNSDPNADQDNRRIVLIQFVGFQRKVACRRFHRNDISRSSDVVEKP